MHGAKTGLPAAGSADAAALGRELQTQAEVLAAAREIGYHPDVILAGRRINDGIVGGLPAEAAIEAALNPDDSAYLYFVADGSGGHAFARTLAEHEANVARWREIEAQQGAAAESAVQTAD